MFYIDYFNLCKKYEAIYGKQTIVLRSVGIFTELYQFNPDHCYNIRDDAGFIWNKNIGHCFNIENILNYAVTMVNVKNPHNINNPYVLGFPSINDDKYIDILLDHNYIVIKLCENDNIQISYPKNRLFGL